jgi:hypothetical protein
MNRTPVDSSNIHSVGHDETGLEVQFHAKDCAARGSVNKCTCKGGDCYHYAGVPAEIHRAMMADRSIGSHFTTQVKNAKDAYGILKYPATKRNGPDYTGI